MSGFNIRIGNLYAGGVLGQRLDDVRDAIFLLVVRPPKPGHFNTRADAEKLVTPLRRLLGVQSVRVVRAAGKWPPCGHCEEKLSHMCRGVWRFT